MSKSEMMEYINSKLPDMNYLDVETVYALVSALSGGAGKEGT